MKIQQTKNITKQTACNDDGRFNLGVVKASLYFNIH